MRFITAGLIILFCGLALSVFVWPQDTIRFESTRVQKMVLCLEDKQIPCRWVGNYNHELGMPIFNYIAPLPYYVGGLLYFVTRDLELVTKILYLLPGVVILLLVGYVLNFRQNKVLFGSVAMVIIVGLYWYLVGGVKLNLGICWFLGCLLLVVFSLSRLSKTPTIRSMLILTTSGVLFLLSDISAVYIYAIGVILVSIYVGLKRRNKLTLLFATSFFLTVGVAAFYIFPMVIESDLVRQNAINEEYLPVSVRSVPGDEILPEVSVLVGSADIFGYEERTNRFRFGIENNDHTIVRLAIPYYPNWTIKANGERVNNYYENNSLGLITLIFGEGRFVVEGKLEDTPVREISNIVSGVTMVLVLFLLFSEMGHIRNGVAYYLKALHS